MRGTEKTSSTAHAGFDSLEQEVYLNLWRTYDCLKKLEENLFGGYELSAQQYNALRLLQAAHPGAMKTMELGQRLISRCPDTTRLLDRLEKRKLISRSRVPDNRRVVEVMITDAGQKLLEKMAAGVEQMHREQLGHLSVAKQERLVKLLKSARHPHDDESCDWLDE